MAARGEVARQYPSHASSADDSNSHVKLLRASSHSFCSTTLPFSIARTVLILGILASFALFGILFKLWQCGIHLIPRVRVGCPHIHLRVEPAWIIQARRSDRGKLRDRVGLHHNRYAAVRAKTPTGLAARLTGRGMEAE